MLATIARTVAASAQLKLICARSFHTSERISSINAIGLSRYITSFYFAILKYAARSTDAHGRAHPRWIAEWIIVPKIVELDRQSERRDRAARMRVH